MLDILDVMPGSDGESFRALYEANYERISSYMLRRALSPEDAADAVAETFLTAWRRMEVVPDGEEATMWLYVTARRVLGNQRRSSDRRRRLLDRIRHQPLLGREERTDSGAVGEAFSRLRADDQEVLGLIAWDGLTHRQVGSVLGCSENAAKLRVARARQRFAAELSRLDVRLPTTNQPAIDRSPKCATHIGGGND